MPDNLNKIRGADKDLRRARDRFNSEKTQAALQEAILGGVPGATVFDVPRIISQLGARLREFKQIERFQDFRVHAVAWAMRQAELNVKLRGMFRELIIGGHIETMLYMRLPEFTGTDEEFREWVSETAQREQAGLDALAGWITGYRNKVRRGIWRVLRNCYDLGVSGGFSSAVSPATSDGEDDLGDISADDEDDSSEPVQGSPVLDELEVEAWRKVAYSTGEILSSPEPIGTQLWWKGYWVAMAWKSGRLYEHKKQEEDKYTIGLHGLERIARADDGDEAVEIAGDDLFDPNGNLNPIVIRELVWTDFDVERELRRAGPFRADDVYDVEGQVLAAA